MKLTWIALSLVLALAPLFAPPERRSSAASPSSAPFVTFTQVADSSTAIPEGTGTFTNFPYAPAIDAGNVAFLGTGAGGQQGFISGHNRSILADRSPT